MHQEATAVLLGAKLWDIEGKSTPPGSYIGPILGPSLAILWVMLKLSGATKCCSAMLLDLCFKTPPPQKHQDFKWVLASYVGSICGSSARIEATMSILGPRLGRSLAILDHVKVSGSYSPASWAKLELSQAMLGHVVEAIICQIFLGDVVGFASKNALPPAGPRF